MASKQKQKEQLKDIPVASIGMDEKNERRAFQVAELEASIAGVGLLERVQVYPTAAEPPYCIRSGHRRFVACKALEWSTIPCIVVPPPEQETDRALLRLAANGNREDVDPIACARTFQALHEAGVTQDEIGVKLGKSQSWVSNVRRLLELPDAIQALISSGDLDTGHGLALLQLTEAPLLNGGEGMTIDECRRSIAVDAVSNEWSVNRVRKEVKGILELNVELRKETEERERRERERERQATLRKVERSEAEPPPDNPSDYAPHGIRIMAHPKGMRASFEVDREISDAEWVNLLSREEAEQRSPLALRIFALPEVVSVGIGRTSITVFKEDSEPWGPLAKQIGTVIREHVLSGESAVLFQSSSPEDPQPTTDAPAEEPLEPAPAGAVTPADRYRQIEVNWRIVQDIDTDELLRALKWMWRSRTILGSGCGVEMRSIAYELKARGVDLTKLDAALLESLGLAQREIAPCEGSPSGNDDDNDDDEPNGTYDADCPECIKYGAPCGAHEPDEADQAEEPRTVVQVEPDGQLALSVQQPAAPSPARVAMSDAQRFALAQDTIRRTLATDMLGKGDDPQELMDRLRALLLYVVADIFEGQELIDENNILEHANMSGLLATIAYRILPRMPHPTLDGRALTRCIPYYSAGKYASDRWGLNEAIRQALEAAESES